MIADGKRKKPFGRRLASFAINTLLVSCSLYISAVASSFLLPKFKQSLLYSDEVLAQLVDGRLLQAQIDLASKEGYSPIFRPHSFNYSYKLRHLSKTKSAIVVGAIPYQNAFVCDEGYGLIREKLDRFGLRNADFLWDDVRKIDVILVGDSMAFGECVQRKHNISSRLTVGGLTTVNMGIGSNSTGEYTLIQKIFVNKINPDYLAVMFHPNDRSSVESGIFFEFKDNEEFSENYVDLEGTSLVLSSKMKNFYAGINSLIKAENNVVTRSASDAIVSFLQRVIRSRHWRLDGLRPYLAGAVTRRADAIDSGTRTAIMTAINGCIDVGCTPIFVFVPNDMFFDRISGGNAYKENIRTFLRDLKKPLIDMTNAIDTNKALAYAPKGGHLSPLGYQLVADAISEEISRLENE